MVTPARTTMACTGCPSQQAPQQDPRFDPRFQAAALSGQLPAQSGPEGRQQSLEKVLTAPASCLQAHSTLIQRAPG